MSCLIKWPTPCCAGCLASVKCLLPPSPSFYALIDSNFTRCLATRVAQLFHLKYDRKFSNFVFLNLRWNYFNFRTQFRHDGKQIALWVASLPDWIVGHVISWEVEMEADAMYRELQLKLKFSLSARGDYQQASRRHNAFSNRGGCSCLLLQIL